VSNVIEVTPTQKLVLDVISEAIKHDEQLSLKDIAERTRKSTTAVNAALVGRKKYKSDGLYTKVPELRNIIVYRVRGKTKYDVSLIREAGGKG